MITSIALKNWKSHELTRISFGAGTNLFVGAMGAGKTSVIEAMSFALFGTFPAVKARRFRLSDVVSRNSPSASAQVELTFVHGANQYRVVRRAGGPDSSQAQVFCNDKLVEAQPARANELIESVLGVDYDLFSRIIYAEQNRIDYLLSAPKGERKRQVDELMGISAFESARSNSATLANRLKSERATAVSFLDALHPQEIENRLSAANANLATSEQKSRRIAQESQSAQELKSSLQGVLGGLEAKQARFHQLGERKSSLDALVRRLTEEFNESGAIEAEVESATESGAQEEVNRSAQSVEALKKSSAALSVANVELGRLEAESASLARQIDASAPALSIPLEEAQAQETVLASRLAAISEQISALSNKAASQSQNAKFLSAKASERGQIKSRLASLAAGAQETASMQSALEAAEKNLAEASSKLAGAQGAIEALSHAGALCPTCGTPLSEASKQGMLSGHERHQREETAAISSLEKERLRASSALAELREKAAQAGVLSSSLSALGGVEAELSACELELALLESKLSRLKPQKEQCEKELAAARETLSLSKAAALAQKLSAELALALSDANARLALKTRQAEGLRAQYSDAALASAQGRLEKAKAVARAVAIKSKLAIASNESREAAAELSSLAFDASSLADARSRLSDATEQHARLLAQLSGEQQRLRELADSAQSLRQAMDSVSSKRTQLVELERKEAASSKFQSSVVETQKALREELVGAINAAMADIWPIIYPYRDYTSLRQSALDDDYSLEVLTMQGDWTGIESCSGGERSCAALCMRIAFALVLTPGLSWIILDEPTHNLDSRAVQMLSSALHERLPSVVEQVFIVTHDEKLKEGASGKTFFFERDKDAGGRTSVEEISFSA
ncbi:MAG: SMC family ATPase [Candidatus Micrarchaeota archaeon]